MNNDYFAYIRVSTKQQGDGASLPEQRAAIEAYAVHHGLNVVRWFEETRTAAKTGRREFAEMIRELRKRRAAGVVIHKIDRSARNARDWADVGDLIDSGVDVRFAHNDLDLKTRGGRLTADLLAVVAADFIRNNREEVKKCMYGWLKKGHYPWPPPPGYLNQAKRRSLKRIDPVAGPIVAKAFSLYDTGKFSIDTLREELARLGLRTRAGKPLAPDAISKLLRNPFYVGIIRIQRTGDIYEGQHPPLVSKRLFDRVQARLDGRVFPRKPSAPEFRFRRLMTCGACGRSLSGERQKGRNYYRCHAKTCRGVCLSEDQIERSAVEPLLTGLELDVGDIGDIRDVAAHLLAEGKAAETERLSGVERDLGVIAARMQRLTDAMIDGQIEKEDFDERKSSLLLERGRLQEIRDSVSEEIWPEVLEKFELGSVAKTQYILADDAGKRDILISLGSNFIVDGKNIAISLHSPFSEILKSALSRNCGPLRGQIRTGKPEVEKLLLEIESAVSLPTSPMSLTSLISTQEPGGASDAAGSPSRVRRTPTPGGVQDATV